MKYLIIILLIAWIIWTYLFFTDNKKSNKQNKTLETKNIKMEDLKEVYFAGWCFWCMEWIFEAQNGVSEAIAWYLGWDKESAKYDQVSSWNTKHREWVKVIYNPDLISFEKLSELFWTQIDPTDEGWQFADRGFHYTTAMYYNTEEEKEILEKSKKTLEESGKFDEKIATKILPFETFFEAEEYHQDYYKKSATRYKLYKKWSGREDFIEDNWEERIKELEKENPHSISPKGREVATILWYKEYSEENLKNTKQENIVLFFHATWCPSCKAFEEKVLSENIPEDILILKVDFDKANDLRKKYNILTQTSFILIDSDWNLINRWIWSRNISDIIKKINESKSLEINNVKVYTDEELREKLTPMQYKVAVEWWTEPAFNNKYWDHKEEWIYVDVIDGTPLFSSTDKYDSGTGWPSFTKPINDNFIMEEDDYKLISKRTEVRTSSSHLWHVFEDWPSETWWLRYCINSASLNFIPKEDLEGTEYEKYLKLFD